MNHRTTWKRSNMAGVGQILVDGRLNDRDPSVTTIPTCRHQRGPWSLKNLLRDPLVRPGIIANTCLVSPHATMVTYRCRRLIDVSSTNSTREGRRRRRSATRRTVPNTYWIIGTTIAFNLAIHGVIVALVR